MLIMTTSYFRIKMIELRDEEQADYEERRINELAPTNTKDSHCSRGSFK